MGLDRSRIPLIIAEHVLCATHHNMDLIAECAHVSIGTAAGKGNKGHR